jgi:hypothetical protein
MEEKRNSYRIMAGKQQGNRPLGRPRCRWVHNSKIDVRYDAVVMMWPRIGTCRGFL